MNISLETTCEEMEIVDNNNRGRDGEIITSVRDGEMVKNKKLKLKLPCMSKITIKVHFGSCCIFITISLGYKSNKACRYKIINFKMELSCLPKISIETHFSSCSVLMKFSLKSQIMG
jgi:hypothetical protein